MMYGFRGITVSSFQVSGQVELDKGAAKAGRINYGKSSLLIRKSTISVGHGFHSCVKLPEGIPFWDFWDRCDGFLSLSN